MDQRTAKRNSLYISTPQKLELIRRVFCNPKIIKDFFFMHSDTLKRDPHLEFNIEKASIGANLTFKVIRDCSSLPLIISDEKLPHLTACVSFNPCGYVVKPMVILPNLIKIKSLCDFTSDCLFTTSQTGWMTKNYFWCIQFFS